MNDLYVRGNVDIQSQYYIEDTLIGAPEVDEATLWNAFMNLNIGYKQFELQMRYEYFQPPMLNLPRDYQGHGIPFIGLSYQEDNLNITAGSFYDQIGSGLILRSFWEPNLGIDNFLDGFKAEYSPIDGMDLKVLAGKQRNFWDFGSGIVRAGDIDLNATSLLNQAFDTEIEDQFTFGFGATSRYQADRDVFLKLPENVLATSARAGWISDQFQLQGEFAYKINDPTILNKYVYNDGKALLMNAAYFTDGFSVNLDFHTLDNFDFRNERTAQQQVLFLNFVPPLNKQHTYRLATVFPYATQATGEFGFAGDVTIDLPKGYFFSGDYDAKLAINYSQINELDTMKVDEFKYQGDIFDPSDVLYFRDFNIEYYRKWNKKIKSTVTYLYQDYNRDVMENDRKGKWGMVQNHILILDLAARINRHNSIRFEAQKTFYSQDSSFTDEPDRIAGDWVMGLVEYSNTAGWFLTLWSEYNYGNPLEENQINYLNGSVAYVHGTNRYTLGYGRQREGWLCVGGVCRLVPASNGLFMQITSTF
ncbi:MAG: hypothetical protein Kapaf2KO_11160 [Candidatus Kapaibacteriales bacterium]